jgi:membrane-bound metal-dependent hydrolase YbcI (DUF457 family)
MDVIYHALVGAAIAKSTGSPYILSSAIFAVLPDLVGAVPFVYYKLTARPGTLLQNVKESVYSNTFTNSVDRIMYSLTHSLVFALLVSLLSYLFFPAAWVTLSLSYVSHIIIDIPTHEGDFATRIFYPYSDFHFESKNWATNPRLFFTFWGVFLAWALFPRFL